MIDQSLRNDLVAIALKWQEEYGVAPSITSTVSEFDAAMLVGMPASEYGTFMRDKTAVQRGSDFDWQGKRYQVKANRPSGKPGSRVTLVPKAKNYEWDFLIWILYDTQYQIVESWIWGVDEYKKAFDEMKRLSPKHYRCGERLV